MPWSKELSRVADTTAKRSSRQRPKSTASRVSRYEKLFEPQSSGDSETGDLPDIALRALQGERGAKQAQSAYQALMEGDYTDEQKARFTDFYHGKSDDTGEGGGGWLNRIFSNPLMKPIATGMELLSLPGRATVATGATGRGWITFGTQSMGVGPC